MTDLFLTSYNTPKQIMLYINITLGILGTLAVLTWQITNFQIAHEEDPNATLEKRKKNGIIASVLGLSMFSIVTTINLFF
jgi:uncharacterized membrane protein